MLTSLDLGELAVMVVLYRYPVPLSILAMPAKRCRELRTIAETGRKKRARSASGFAIDAPFVARPAGGGKRPRGKGSFLAKAQYGRDQRKACPPPGCEPGFARCTPPATTNRPFPPDPLHHCVGAGLVLAGALLIESRFMCSARPEQPGCGDQPPHQPEVSRGPESFNWQCGPPPGHRRDGTSTHRPPVQPSHRCSRFLILIETHLIPTG